MTPKSMTRIFLRRHSALLRVSRTLLFAAASLWVSALAFGEANAQALGYASTQQGWLSTKSDVNDSGLNVVPERLRRAVVAFTTSEASGTIIIDSGNTVLYYVLGQSRAIRYGVGVGREGFGWSGVQTVSRKAEWPDWYPPAEMIARQPYLPRFVAGGPANPLGARAMYLGSSPYRIHGANDPSTIGKFVSSGCIRMTNEDVSDLFERVNVGTKVVVLSKNSPRFETGSGIAIRATTLPPPVVTRLSSGRRAVNLSISSLY